LAVFGAARYLAPPAGLALLMVAPFLSGLHAPPLGVALVTGEHADPARFLLIWFTPLLPLAVAMLLLARAGALRTSRRHLAGALVLVVVALAAWALALAGTGDGGELADRGAGWVTLVALGLAIA